MLVNRNAAAAHVSLIDPIPDGHRYSQASLPAPALEQNILAHLRKHLRDPEAATAYAIALALTHPQLRTAEDVTRRSIKAQGLIYAAIEILDPTAAAAADPPTAAEDAA